MVKRLFPFVFAFFIGCSHMDEAAKEVSQVKPEAAPFVKAADGRVFYTGLKIPKNFKPQNVRPAYVRGEELPAAFDWRDKVELMPVRNQGGCGSCWSFSSVATFEDVRRIQGEKEDLSEQYLVSCNQDGWGCNGGFFAYNYMMAPKGGVSEASYPYTGTDSACKGGLVYGAKIKSWAYLPGGDNAGDNINEIKAALFKYGPLGVGVAADDSFSNYRSGIFHGSGSTELNHAVNLVGWNDNGGDGYWIMRNSWGASWGENGFMKISYKANRIGAWANYVVYEKGDGPTPDPDPNPNPDPEPCTPKPFASTGFGDLIKARVGQQINMGTKPLAEHTYYWTASPAFDGGAQPPYAQIKYRPRITKRLTLHAVTKCGEATDSVTVQVIGGLRGKKLGKEVE